MKSLPSRLYDIYDALIERMVKFITDWGDGHLDSETWQAVEHEIGLMEADMQLLKADALKVKGLEIMNERYVKTKDWFDSIEEDLKHDRE